MDLQYYDTVLKVLLCIKLNEVGTHAAKKHNK